MTPVLFLAEARRDIDEAWLYVAIHDEMAADRLLDAIDERASVLADYPLSGRARPELGEALRSLSAPPYILYYRVVENIVEIVRVLHSARDVSTIFDQDQ